MNIRCCAIKRYSYWVATMRSSKTPYLTYLAIMRRSSIDGAGGWGWLLVLLLVDGLSDGSGDWSDDAGLMA